jgi:hypothetical protein
MSDLLERMAEANIRDWNRRKAAGQTGSARPLMDDFDSLESQLFKEVLALHAQAHAVADPDEAARLRRKAADARIRLLVTVEKDRPRLAQVLDARLTQALARPHHPEENEA